MNHECSLCKKQFKSIPYLKMHIRNVHGDSNKKTKCEICGNTFAKYNYKDHMVKVHSEIKNVKCDICSKTISSINNLKIHIATHEKKHKCNSCDEAFTNPKLLKHHFNKVHAPTKCDICDVEFNYPTYLKRHMVELHAKIKVENNAPKYDRRAKISSFKNKEEIDSEQVCLVCNKSCKLSSILPHLLQHSKKCGVDYPKQAFEDLKERCKEYKTQRNKSYNNKRFHNKMLDREEKLLSKAKEQNLKYKKQYLPQLHTSMKST